MSPHESARRVSRRRSRLATARVAQAADALPPRPAALVTDTARVLLPERAQALNDFLLAGARERGIWIYVVTVPSLGAMPSAQPRRLSETAHRYADRWTKGQVAAVVLFDDESRRAIVVASAETDRRFPHFSRNMALGDPLTQIQHDEGLARDKLEATARAMLGGLSQLHDEADASARRHRVADCAMGAVLLVGLALLLHALWRKEPRGPGAKAEEF